ncbi:hypothetical protein AWC15_15120 [Mycobacterium lacus]|uniref:Uncharacterized protein n=1 Tax=Mycobacterium lacus TaxID=169765 RepID=A0A1X1YNI1_9MYCO|nr:hypothetical protein AWC15_15120 [Mycobacterium lacus]BBX98478.1 hypothetical protein MLAC_37720 [Mycobacterium lacus]
MVAQRLTAIRRAECPATLLQERHHLTDEFAQAVRGQVRHQDEPVAGVRLDTAVDLMGDVRGGADEPAPW